MPRRDDLRRIMILGSGPIVIGQAAEFDYSGVQACKVLREEGYEVVLVNSNPATIMTDPEFADATYVEPLLPASGRARHREASAPTRCFPTLGGQTALNLAKALARGRDAARSLRGRAHRGRTTTRSTGPRTARLFARDDGRGPGSRCPSRRSPRRRRRRRASPPCARSACPRSCAPPSPSAAAAAAIARTRRSSPRLVASWPRRLADHPDPHRQVGDRLGRVRARGDARPQRQRGDRLLDREPRPDGRAHRRLGHRRPAADAHRRPLPAAARPGDQGDPRGRGGDRRLERAVRGQPGDRGDPRHRDEPAGLALQRPGLQGHRGSRSPRSPRAWRSATRSRRSQRHHAGHARRASSRRSTTSSSSGRASRSRSSPGERRAAPRT